MPKPNDVLEWSMMQCEQYLYEKGIYDLHSVRRSKPKAFKFSVWPRPPENGIYIDGRIECETITDAARAACAALMVLEGETE